MDVRAFVISLSQISSFFSWYVLFLQYWIKIYWTSTSWTRICYFLIKQPSFSTVFVITCSGDTLRRLMLTASTLGMTGGDYAFIFFRLFKGEGIGDYSWRRNDSEDQVGDSLIYSLIFMPLDRMIGGAVFVLSVCLCVLFVNFNLRYNFWTVRNWDFIFGMHTPLMTPYQITPGSMTLWPWLWP